MVENFYDIVIKLKNLTKQIQDQSKELKCLKHFGKGLVQRIEGILCIFENEYLSEKTKNNAGLDKAVLVILHILENEVKPFLDCLSQDGLEATAKIYVNVKDYTEKYGKISGILDGAIAVLNKGLDIEESITSNKISEESLAVKTELEDIKNTLCGILKQSQERSENIANLEEYVCNLESSISDLHKYSDPSPKEVAKINKKFYYSCAGAENGLALNIVGDLGLNGNDVNALQEGVQSQQAVFIGCAFGKQAIVLPAGNNAAIQGALSLFKHLEEKDGKKAGEASLGVPPDFKSNMNNAIDSKEKPSSNFEKKSLSLFCCSFSFFSCFSCEFNESNGKHGEDMELSSPNRFEQ